MNGKSNPNGKSIRQLLLESGYIVAEERRGQHERLVTDLKGNKIAFFAFKDVLKLIGQVEVDMYSLKHKDEYYTHFENQFLDQLKCRLA